MKHRSNFHRRELHKRVATESNGGVGYTSVKDGAEICDLELDVDLEGLVRMYAHDAMKNVSGTARRCHGLVKLRVVRRERVPA